MNPKDWFDIYKEKDYLIVIRESLEKVDPRFYTDMTNIYLLLGNEKALLIDTGSGVFSLKSNIDDLIEGRQLTVVNTHGHWDHIGNNHEFERVYIHKNESGFISNPVNISNLKSSPEKIAKNYEDMDFLLAPPSEVSEIDEGYIFDIGNLSIEVLHTPGHSPGSISLLTNKGELFAGDLVHYGSVFLPKKKYLNIVSDSLQRVINLFNNGKADDLYPAHGVYPQDKELVVKLFEGINNLDRLWDQKQKDKFLRSWIIEEGTFKFVISRF